MKTLHFAIIGSSSANTHDLIESIVAKGHTADIILIPKLSFQNTGNDFRISTIDKDMADFDIVILRSFTKNTLLARMLVKYLIEKNTVVIDEVIGTRDFGGKVFQAQCFAEHALAHPQTFHSLDATLFEEWLKVVKLPVIAKPVFGQKGIGIEKLEDAEKALSFFEIYCKEYLFQEYVPITYDTRVFIVGDIVLGAIRRNVIKGDFRSNVSLGAYVESIEVSLEIKTLALQAKKALGYEIAGVDIIEHQGKIMVLEVNDTPQWQGFKKSTGINPAHFIIKYALEKYARKQAH